jgi:hypothetical protein
MVMLILAPSAGLSGAKPSHFNKHDKAYYVSQAVIDFVRPGLVVEIQSASISADGTIQAQFTVADTMGLPLDKDGITTPGPISIQLVAVAIPKDRRQYVAYTTQFIGPPATKQSANLPSADSGGTFKNVADGQYQYTFATKAPSGFDAAETHTIGLMATRDLTQFNLEATTQTMFLPSCPTARKLTSFAISFELTPATAATLRWPTTRTRPATSHFASSATRHKIQT